MYLISYKMIYGVDLQRCVLQEIASLDKKETERPTLLRIWRSITLHDIFYMCCIYESNISKMQPL